MGKFYFSRDKLRERGNYPNFQKLFEKLKKRQRLLQTALLLIVGLLASTNAIAAADYDFWEKGLYYNITSEDDRTVEVIRDPSYWADGYTGSISVPTTVEYRYKTYTVTKISAGAFIGSPGLTSITVADDNPNYASKDGVLYSKDMTELICYPAGNEEQSFSIPNSVTTICSDAFSECASLRSIEIPNSVTAIIGGLGAGAFRNCTSLRSIVIPNSVTSIGSYTFERSALSSIEIPSSVTFIGKYAFTYCKSLSSVKISNGITSIQEGLFYNCTYLSSVEIPNSVTGIEDRAFYGCTKLTSIELPNNLKYIRNKAFGECSSLSSIEIPKVSTIGDYAFSGCTSLISVEIPSGTIEEVAFGYCTNLTSVKILDGVSSIWYEAFKKCDNLETVEIGKNVKRIEYGVFYDDYNIKTIYCKATIPPYLEDLTTFNSKTYEDAVLYVPVGTKVDYEVADGWKDFANIKEMDFSGVASVDNEAVSVVAEGGRIVVSGVDGNEPMEVYTTAGQLVYRGVATTIDVANRGIYIVRIAGSTYKLAL